MNDELSEILLASDVIASRVEEIAAELGRRLSPLAEQDEPVVLVPVLTGSLVFTADLIRQLPQKMRLDVVTISSYAGATTESRGARIRGAVPENLEGQHIVLVDDIFDTATVISITVEMPASVADDQDLALEIADRGYVLVQGANRFTDTGAALLANADVRKSFLGG